MNKNKVIDQLVKKLIVNNFDKKDIFDFVNLSNQFRCFENFIYYLLLLSQKNYDDKKFNMARCLKDFLLYLVSTNNIKPITIQDIKVNDVLCDQELYIMNVKGYRSDKNFYFDVDDNLYICLDNVEYDEYKNILNIKYNDDFYDNKTNMKIFNRLFNYIYVFKREGNLNRFLGTYSFLFNAWIYKNNFEYRSFVIVNEDGYDLNLIQEFDNLNSRSQRQAINQLKKDILNNILKFTNSNSSILKNIISAECHLTLSDAVVQFCLNQNKIDLLKEIHENFFDLIYRRIQATDLIPFLSKINEYQLALISNCYDILKGCQITSDYLNNIFICTDDLEFESGGVVSLRFIKSFKQHFFDLKLNKKIFNTINSNACIYLFKKINDKYLFLGIYKCFKITVGKDLKWKQTPIFKMRQISDNEYVKHVKYVKELKVSNSYKNAFINVVKNNPQFSKWISKLDYDNEIINSVKMEKLNSLLYKYNWIIDKCLITIDEPQAFLKNYKLYKVFENKNIKTIFNVISDNFLFLTEGRILQPYTIAYEMTKNNWSEKELFNISYIDHYQTLNYKYNLLEHIIKNRS